MNKKWKKIIDYSIKKNKYWSLTSTNLQMKKLLIPLFKQIKPGSKVLDLGAGSLVFKQLFPKNVKYVSADIEKTSPDIDYICNARNLPFKNNQYDYILCSAVLEHIKEPNKVLSEIYRVLKPNGKVFLTVPHMHYLHSEPKDFWRFTKYGIGYLVKKNKFINIKVIPVGGFISYLASIISTIVLIIFSYLPIIFNLVCYINSAINYLVIKLDKILDKKKKFALGYIVEASK